MEIDRNIHRDWLYIPSGEESLFAWLHSADVRQNGKVAIICNPLGVEYMSGHRSIRHFADYLAINGLPALRFDYAVAGDSTGRDFTSVRTSTFVENIGSAVAAAKSCTGLSDVVLIGIGLGATFAAMAAETARIAQLVLWNPTVSGKRFLREQKLMSEVLGTNTRGRSGTIDSAGILLSMNLQEDFHNIDMAKLSFGKVDSVLLITRSDMKPNARLEEAIQRGPATLKQLSLPGYREMMDIPTDTKVPRPVFEHIIKWISNTPHGSQHLPIGGRGKFSTPIKCVALPAGDQPQTNLTEAPVCFGHHSHLFGIVTSPSSQPPSGRAFVFLNCGSEHHAGPHRMYTRLARSSASGGHLSFRFDIEGLGDSVSRGNNEDNNAYSPIAIQDIEQALVYLTEQHSCTEFVLTGICAGAYHAFKATAILADFNIIDANLVNPLVFEWDYDNPEDHVEFEAHTYRSSVRNVENWMRLFKGDINYHRLTRSIYRLISEKVRRMGARHMNFGAQKSAEGLPYDLQQIAKAERRLNIILSDGDPGLDIMRMQAGPETSKALRDGWLTVQPLHNANHGLSKMHMQDQLISMFVDKYGLDQKY